MTKKTKKGDAPGGREFIGLLPRNPTPRDVDDFAALIIAHIKQAKAEEERRATTKRPRPRQGSRSQSSAAPAAKRRR